MFISVLVCAKKMWEIICHKYRFFVVAPANKVKSPKSTSRLPVDEGGGIVWLTE